MSPNPAIRPVSADAACPPALPRRLRDYRGRHAGETLVVCGCGVSLHDLPEPRRWITVGVNDVGRHFDPTYLVVVNPKGQFRGDRFGYVEASRAQAVFTQLRLGIPHPCVVRFRLGQRGGTDLSDPDRLPYTRNSPYVAVCLAALLGAKRIGLIGVDFTDHHFFAQTGRHPLTRELRRIDAEYAGLAKDLAARGVELVNLSLNSRLASLPKVDPQVFLGAGPRALAAVAEPAEPTAPRAVPAKDCRRVFFVHYQFLSCGDVFTRGLDRAARELGLDCAHAACDERDLPRQVEKFSPDLLFVVHGRKFRQRWGNRFRRYPSAVWLLDEPYEVDDTALTSALFDTVFVNDPSTLGRHRNAHSLPVAYDPFLHREVAAAKRFDIGFIGGHNPTRERVLIALAEAGLLSYVVGGPWKSQLLRRLCLSRNIPPAEAVALYQQTRLVVNVFRDLHHFNRKKIAPRSMNPRVYEALACGAVVVSEERPEVLEVFPELPTFAEPTESVAVSRRLLEDGVESERIRQSCLARLTGHTYADRLRRVLEITAAAGASRGAAGSIGGKSLVMSKQGRSTVQAAPPGWLDHGGISTIQKKKTIQLVKEHDDTPASELGLASADSFSDLELTFEVKMGSDACFVAKVFQADQFDQATNSYHLFCHPNHSYLGRHHRVLHDVPVSRGVWQHIGLSYDRGQITVTVNGDVAARVRDETLHNGYCFLGVKGGEVWLRNIAVTPSQDQIKTSNDETTALASRNDPSVPSYRVHCASGASQAPTVSIITSVYDRVHCLRECIGTVRRSHYQNFEHIIVSDHPPKPVVQSILELVGGESHKRIVYADLDRRHNNWGISPAAAGLSLARGKYVCFLSDDNGFAPDHLSGLVQILDTCETAGFAYSSCRYAGRLVLRHPVPRPGGIDLGQPLFRRELFDTHLGGSLPFDMFAWDWHMIEHFVKSGVKWRHLDRPTFWFRLAACRKRWPMR